MPCSFPSGALRSESHLPWSWLTKKTPCTSGPDISIFHFSEYKKFHPGKPIRFWCCKAHRHKYELFLIVFPLQTAQGVTSFLISCSAVKMIIWGICCPTMSLDLGWVTRSILTDWIWGLSAYNSCEYMIFIEETQFCLSTLKRYYNVI